MFSSLLSGLRKKKQQSIIFEITLRCNLDCRYCYNVCKNEKPYPSGELPTEEVKKLLKKVVKETNCMNVTFTGGEPYLRDDLIEIIRDIKQYVPTVNVITNGTLLNEDNIKASIEAGVSIFELPLLSSYRDIHNYLVRGNSFDKVTEAIAMIKANGGRVVTVFVATKKNLQTWEETIEMSLALGADGIMFNRFNPGGEGRKFITELSASPMELSEALEAANRATEQYKISIACSIAMHPCIFDTEKYPNLGFGFCAAGTERAYYTIDPVGNLRMCNHSQIIIGNVLKTNFQKLAKSKKVKEFMNAIPRFCVDCKMAKTCQGGCKAAAEVCYQDLYEEDPYLKINKNYVIKKR